MITRLSIFEVDNKIKKTKLYFEEDCSGSIGSHFKKGKEITENDLKKLYRYGYNIIWVNDGKPVKTKNEDIKKIDAYIYDKKNDIESVVGRGTFIIDEAQIRKPESSLKFFDGEDLLKQNINALQKDGAKIILKQLYGDRGKKIIPLKTIINKIYKDDIQKFGIFDNISIGNAHLKKKGSKKNGKKDLEITNCYLKSSVITGIGFLITLNNILKKRNPRFEGVIASKIDHRQRPPYKKNRLIDASFASCFADMGYLHVILDNNIKKITKNLFTEEGELIDEGQAKLDERIVNILDRHTNIITHILTSDKSDPPLITEIEEEMIKYEHRGLNGAGYPKRNMVTETVTKVINDETNETRLEVKTLFDSELRELPRLLGIINSFVGLLLGTPWRLPVERDMLVRYYKMNSQYPPNPNLEPDEDGVWDFTLRDRYKKRFDAYLLDEFLNSIYLYKLGEQVPIYDIKNPEENKFHAMVIGYTDQPNRPIVIINDKGNKKEINLSEEEFNHYFIGEYCPAVKLKNVLETYAPKKAEFGIYLPEDLYVPEDEKTSEDGVKESKIKKELDKEVDNLFDEGGPDIDELSEKASDDDVDALLAQFIPSGGGGTSAKKKEDENNKANSQNKNKSSSETDEKQKTNTKKEIKTGLFDDDDDIEDEEIMEDLNYIYKINDFGIKELYGLGIVTKKAEGLYLTELTHTAVVVKTKTGNDKYRIVKIHPAHREKFDIYENHKAKNVPIDYPKFIIGKKVDKEVLNASPYMTLSDTYKEGDFFYLYYVNELDPKKNPNYKTVDPTKYKGMLTYIVKVVKKTEKPEKPIVKFFFISKKANGKVAWKKDNHYGQEVDMRKIPFFRLDRKVTSSELASIIGLK